MSLIPTQMQPTDNRPRPTSLFRPTADRRRPTLPLLLAASMLIAGCDREERRFQESPPTVTADNVVQLTSLEPGVPRSPVTVVNRYAHNSYAISEGQRLFNWMNCSGCHANGGGGIGPPLMDDLWIYGAEPENVFQTIVQGRPNGMPAFQGRLSNQQVWQLVAYVRSLSRLTPGTVLSSRTDDMHVTSSPAVLDSSGSPQQAAPPKSTSPRQSIGPASTTPPRTAMPRDTSGP